MRIAMVSIELESMEVSSVVMLCDMHFTYVELLKNYDFLKQIIFSNVLLMV